MAFSDINAALEVMRIQTHLFVLASSIPFDRKYDHLRNRLTDASVALADSTTFLDVFKDENLHD